MTSIPQIDTSVYRGLLESLNTNTSGRNNSAGAVRPTYNSSNAAVEPVDLSNYYANIANSDLLREIGENVAQSAEDLDNAMVSALENGMSVQDACNINSCMAAYKANAQVLGSVSSMMKSTFEIMV